MLSASSATAAESAVLVTPLSDADRTVERRRLDFNTFLPPGKQDDSPFSHALAWKLPNQTRLRPSSGPYPPKHFRLLRKQTLGF
jgi:hypothetical protein